MGTSHARQGDEPPKRRRGRPADRRGEDTRAAIIATAQRLFGRAGFHGVSLQAIADECGLDSRALYHHFPSKRLLFDAAAVDALDRMGREVLSQVFSQSGSTHRIDSYIEVFRRVHASHPDLLGFVGMLLVDHRSAGGSEMSLLQVTAEPDGGPLIERGGAFRSFLEVFIDDGIAAGEITPDLDRAGTVLLLMAIGMGISLVSTSDADAFPAMLDSFERLAKGEFFIASPRPDERPSSR